MFIDYFHSFISQIYFLSLPQSKVLFHIWNRSFRSCPHPPTNSLNSVSSSHIKMLGQSFQGKDLGDLLPCLNIINFSIPVAKYNFQTPYLCIQIPYRNVCTLSFNSSTSVLFRFSSVQLSSVAQSCLTLCNSMNCSMPGLPINHQLPEFTQSHVHRVGDAKWM